jgi:hypothetical protein
MFMVVFLQTFLIYVGIAIYERREKGLPPPPAYTCRKRYIGK